SRVENLLGPRTAPREWDLLGGSRARVLKAKREEKERRLNDLANLKGGIMRSERKAALQTGKSPRRKGGRRSGRQRRKSAGEVGGGESLSAGSDESSSESSDLSSSDDSSSSDEDALGGLPAG